MNPAVAIIIIIIIMIILHRWNMFTLIEKAREFLIELYIYIYQHIRLFVAIFTFYLFHPLWNSFKEILRSPCRISQWFLWNAEQCPLTCRERLYRSFGSSSVSKQSFTKEKESCLRAFYYYSIMTIFAIEKMTRKYIFFNQKWQSSSLF